MGNGGSGTERKMMAKAKVERMLANQANGGGEGGERRMGKTGEKCLSFQNVQNV